MGRVGETDGADEREDRDRDSVGSREGGLTAFADGENDEEEDDDEAAPNEEAAVAVVDGFFEIFFVVVVVVESWRVEASSREFLRGGNFDCCGGTVFVADATDDFSPS